MQEPSIGRIVVYTDNEGVQHAAVIAKSPEVKGSGEVELTVFNLKGHAAFDMWASQGDGKGEWQWPQRTAPPPANYIENVNQLSGQRSGGVDNAEQVHAAMEEQARPHREHVEARVSQARRQAP